jgi:hypothetical protein
VSNLSSGKNSVDQLPTQETLHQEREYMSNQEGHKSINLEGEAKSAAGRSSLEETPYADSKYTTARGGWIEKTPGNNGNARSSQKSSIQSA